MLLLKNFTPLTEQNISTNPGPQLAVWHGLVQPSLHQSTGHQPFMFHHYIISSGLEIRSPRSRMHKQLIYPLTAPSGETWRSRALLYLPIEKDPPWVPHLSTTTNDGGWETLCWLQRSHSQHHMFGVDTVLVGCWLMTAISKLMNRSNGRPIKRWPACWEMSANCSLRVSVQNHPIICSREAKLHLLCPVRALTYYGASTSWCVMVKGWLLSLQIV